MINIQEIYGWFKFFERRFTDLEKNQDLIKTQLAEIRAILKTK